MTTDERTTGVILRTRLLTETSLIVHWLTVDAGRLATVARGARRPRSAFRGKLDLFHEADLAYRRSSKSELHTLSEVALRETFPALRTDWRRLSQAAYGVALIELSTEMDTPLPGTWGLFRRFLAEVNRSDGSPLPVLALELQHLEDLGLLPDLERDSLGEASRELAEDLLTWEGEEPLAGGGLVEEVWRPLERFLHGFLIHHLGRLPRGRGEALGGGRISDLSKAG